MKPPRVSPVHRRLRSLKETWYTRQEVADQLGITVDRLRSLQRKHGVGPSNVTWIGRLMVHLYSPADVKAVREHLTVEDRLLVQPLPDQSDVTALHYERDRLYSQRSYHRARLRSTDDDERRERHIVRLEQITARLNDINALLSHHR